jgi:hypothetical protein
MNGPQLKHRESALATRQLTSAARSPDLPQQASRRLESALDARLFGTPTSLSWRCLWLASRVASGSGNAIAGFPVPFASSMLDIDLKRIEMLIGLCRRGRNCFYPPYRLVKNQDGAPDAPTQTQSQSPTPPECDMTALTANHMFEAWVLQSPDIPMSYPVPFRWYIPQLLKHCTSLTHFRRKPLTDSLRGTWRIAAPRRLKQHSLPHPNALDPRCDI